MIRLPVILFLIVGPQFASSQLLQAVAATTLTSTAGGSGAEAISGNMLAGYSIGLTADFPLMKGSSCDLRSGVLLDRWGSRFPAAIGNARRSLHINYVQMPVLLAKRLRLSLLTDFLVAAGPYIACRIGSPSQIFTTARIGNHIRTFLYQNDGTKNNYYRRLDYGLSFHCSIEMHNRFSIGLQYDNGLLNILRNGDGATLRNEALSLSLRYFLNLPSFLHRQFPWKEN